MNHAKSVRYLSLFAAILLLSASAFGATHKKKHRNSSSSKAHSIHPHRKRERRVAHGRARRGHVIVTHNWRCRACGACPPRGRNRPLPILLLTTDIDGEDLTVRRAGAVEALGPFNGTVVVVVESEHRPDPDDGESAASAEERIPALFDDQDRRRFRRAERGAS